MLRFFCALCLILASSSFLPVGVSPSQAIKQDKQEVLPRLTELFYSLDRQTENWIREEAKEKTVKRIQAITVNTSLLKVDEKSSKSGITLNINLFDDTSLVCVLKNGKIFEDRGEEGKETTWQWIGVIQKVEGSAVMVSCQGGAVNAEIRTPKDLYQIRPGPQVKSPQGLIRPHAAVMLKEDAFPRCKADSLEPPLKKKVRR